MIQIDEKCDLPKCFSLSTVGLKVVLASKKRLTVGGSESETVESTGFESTKIPFIPPPAPMTSFSLQSSGPELFVRVGFVDLGVDPGPEAAGEVLGVGEEQR